MAQIFDRPVAVGETCEPAPAIVEAPAGHEGVSITVLHRRHERRHPSVYTPRPEGRM